MEVGTPIHAVRMETTAGGALTFQYGDSEDAPRLGEDEDSDYDLACVPRDGSTTLRSIEHFRGWTKVIAEFAVRK
jgi:hypothetical protein